jgi:hypothetical protein
MRHRELPTPEAMSVPPAPPVVSSDRAAISEARRRIEPKWRAFDALLDDYRETDRRLGLRRR